MEIKNPNMQFPIRIISYNIGALLLIILRNNNIDFNDKFNEITYIEDLLINVNPTNIPLNISIKNYIDKFNNESILMVEKAINKNDIVFEGRAKLLGFNVYNARYYNKHIITLFFIMYELNDEVKVEYGNFIVEINDNLDIIKIYRL